MNNKSNQEVPDYGCDPVGEDESGVFRFKMIPSGDIVDREEKERRLTHSRTSRMKNDCLGLSWEKIEQMQGGKLRR